MAWKKMGRIASLESSELRATTHMQGPVAIVLGNAIRIYFSARGRTGKSYPAYVDVDRSDPRRVIQIHEQPVLSFGNPGTFDDEGIMPACAIFVGDALRLYYSGWNRRTTIPTITRPAWLRVMTTVTPFSETLMGPYWIELLMNRIWLSRRG